MTTEAAPGALRMIPLGGLGEIGRNMMLYEYEGAAIAVDVGLMFPEEEMLGVDLVIPEFEYLRENPDLLQAVFLTHGHEDHIGALPFLMREFNVPVFCTKLTRGLVEVKLREHRLLDDAHVQIVEPGNSVHIGPFEVEFFSVSHSIPDAAGLIVHTPVGPRGPHRRLQDRPHTGHGSAHRPHAPGRDRARGRARARGGLDVRRDRGPYTLGTDRRRDARARDRRGAGPRDHRDLRLADLASADGGRRRRAPQPARLRDGPVDGQQRAHGARARVPRRR